MNTFIKSTLLVFSFWAAINSLNAQQVAYIQIAHNSADPGLDTIDLYFNNADPTRGYSFVDSNVVFHAATGLIQYPVDSAFTIGINHKHSYSNPNSGSILSVTYPAGTLSADERRVFVISGVQGSGFEPNPDAISTAISIQQAELDTVAPDTGYVSLRFLQGATDLDTVKIIYRNGGQVFPGNFVYGSSTSKNDSVRHNEYELQVLSPDTSKNYGTFSANLTGLGGYSILILGSGFIQPLANDSGPAFGLFGLLNTGAVITFPLKSSGFQMLNNCADPAADSLDIYVNGIKAYPNLGFRNATPGIVFNAYARYDIAIALKNSGSIGQAIWSHSFFFPPDTFFIATASGLLSQTGFAANPSGISTAFDVLIKSPAEFDAASEADFDFYMINGATDAPPFNLVPSGGPYLLTDVPYGDQTNYVSLPSEFYTLYVQDTFGNNLVNGFANFLAFTSQSAVLLTSGFLNPSANNNGAAMGLFMAPTTGGPFIPLYSVTGINKVETGADFKIFPNPASDHLHLLFSVAQQEGISLQISDINGKLIKQVFTNQSFSGAQDIAIDITPFDEGIYFCRLSTANGISNSRFVVAR